MAVGPVAGHGLDDKHQKAGNPSQKTHLGQAQSHLVHEYGKQRADESAVEIAAKVHQA